MSKAADTFDREVDPSAKAKIDSASRLVATREGYLCSLGCACPAR